MLFPEILLRTWVFDKFLLQRNKIFHFQGAWSSPMLGAGMHLYFHSQGSKPPTKTRKRKNSQNIEYSKYSESWLMLHILLFYIYMSLTEYWPMKSCITVGDALGKLLWRLRNGDFFLCPQQAYNLMATSSHHVTTRAECIKPHKSLVSKYWLPLYKWRYWGLRGKLTYSSFRNKTT